MYQKKPRLELEEDIKAHLVKGKLSAADLRRIMRQHSIGREKVWKMAKEIVSGKKPARMPFVVKPEQIVTELPEETPSMLPVTFEKITEMLESDRIEKEPFAYFDAGKLQESPPGIPQKITSTLSPEEYIGKTTATVETSATELRDMFPAYSADVKPVTLDSIKEAIATLPPPPDVFTPYIDAEKRRLPINPFALLRAKKAWRKEYGSPVDEATLIEAQSQIMAGAKEVPSDLATLILSL